MLQKLECFESERAAIVAGLGQSRPEYLACSQPKLQFCLILQRPNCQNLLKTHDKHSRHPHRHYRHFLCKKGLLSCVAVASHAGEHRIYNQSERS